MTLRYISTFIISCSILAGLTLNAQQVIPQPLNIKKDSGSFLIKGSTYILAGTGTQDVAAYLFNELKSVVGISISIKTQPVKGNSGDLMVLTLVGGIKKEGYRLICKPNGLRIEASDAAGLFYGTQTLLQLIDKDKIQSVFVEDYPRFHWRGMMLDVSRHFFDKNEIKKQLDLMSRYKLNVFHWHLTDDQGWRIEIKRYPLLTQKGAWRADRRNEPWSYFNLGSEQGMPNYGGFYTQEDIREVVDYAKKLHISIVPEIDMPGHSWAAIYAYPWLGCSGKIWRKPEDIPFEFSDPLCICKDSVVTFVTDVLGELIELFPSEYINIGGDESKHEDLTHYYPCTDIMQKEKYAKTSALQARFCRQLESYLLSKGRKMIGWDEILEGEINRSTTILSWRGEDGGILAAKSGHDAIMCPGTHLYFDKSNDEINWKKVYDYEPVPAILNDQEAKHILGCQANLWTENIQSIKKIEEMLWPKLLALSEIAWTLPENKDRGRFEKSLHATLLKLDRHGVDYFIPKPILLSTDLLFIEGSKIKLFDTCGIEDASIVYTLDGSEPHALSAKYKQEFEIKESALLKAKTLLPSGKLSGSIDIQFEKSNYYPSVRTAKKTKPGLNYKYFEGKFSSFNDLAKIKPLKMGTVPSIEFPPNVAKDHWGMVLNGLISCNEDNIYTFNLSSDDGSALLIDGKTVVKDDGIHAPRSKSGSIALAKGFHRIEVLYIEVGYGESLELLWGTSGKDKTKISAENLRHSTK